MTQPIEATPLFDWNYNSGKRITVNQGGTSSSKTYSLLQVILTLAWEDPGTLTTITAENFPQLRKGAMENMAQICAKQPFKSWIQKENLGTHTYHLKNGSRVEFAIFHDMRSEARGQSAKGPRRDYLYINEADGVNYDTAKNLILRTRKRVFIDFNPTADFWAHEYYQSSERVGWIFSNFTHNTFLDENTKREILNLRATDPEAWRVYGLGKRGNLQGQVFKNVKFVDEIPTWAGDRLYGLDIGFANSYTALCEIGMADGEIFGDELLYERGLIDEDLEQKLERLGLNRRQRIVCDSANKMTIEYLSRRGWDVVAAVKTRVVDEIGVMRQYKWNITERSTNWKKEAKNYRYEADENGGFKNVPIKNFDHLWDAARYAFMDEFGGSRLPQFR